MIMLDISQIIGNAAKTSDSVTPPTDGSIFYANIAIIILITNVRNFRVRLCTSLMLYIYIQIYIAKFQFFRQD